MKNLLLCLLLLAACAPPAEEIKKDSIAQETLLAEKTSPHDSTFRFITNELAIEIPGLDVWAFSYRNDTVLMHLGTNGPPPEGLLAKLRIGNAPPDSIIVRQHATLALHIHTLCKGFKPVKYEVKPGALSPSNSFALSYSLRIPSQLAFITMEF